MFAPYARHAPTQAYIGSTVLYARRRRNYPDNKQTMYPLSRFTQGELSLLLTGRPLRPGPRRHGTWDGI